MPKELEAILREKVDIYGNEIVRISLRFIRSEITEAERTELYREAGEKHLSNLTSTYHTAEQNTLNRLAARKDIESYFADANLHHQSKNKQ